MNSILFRSLFRPLTYAAVALLPALTAMSQIEGALVAKHGAVVRGKVQGSLLVLDESATVTIERGADLIGDLVLPVEPTRAASPGKSALAPGQVIASRATVAIADTAVIKGRQRVLRSFALPAVEKPKIAAGTDSVTLRTDKDKDPDFTKLKDLTLQSKKRDILLPPGNYGMITVEDGRLILGRKGFGKPARYYFQSLSVSAGGTVDLLGPTVVMVGALNRIDGELGNSVYTNWLDLRVGSGAVVLGEGSLVHGVVTASESAVTMGRGMSLTGGLICDTAVLDTGATFTGVRPSWTKESSGNSLPLFIHKAARVQSRLADSDRLHRPGVDAVVNYREDVPMLTVVKSGSPNRREAHTELREAFFEACCTLFDGTGFSEGVITVVQPSPQKNQTAEATTIAMERWQFEGHLRALAQPGRPRELIQRIRESPLLLNLFMERCLDSSGGVETATSTTVEAKG